MNAREIMAMMNVCCADTTIHPANASTMSKASAEVAALIAERDALREACKTLVDAEHEEDPMAAGMMLACAYEAAKAALALAQGVQS